MNKQEIILQAVTKHKEGRTLKQIYARYQKATKEPVLEGSVLVVLSRLIVKGCVQRPAKGRYRRTNKPYYSDKGQNMPESIYLKAIKAHGDSADFFKILGYIYKQIDKHNKALKPDQKARVKPQVISAIVYIDRLKAQGRIVEKDGHYSLPK